MIDNLNEATRLLNATQLMLLGKDNQPISDLYYALQIAVASIEELKERKEADTWNVIHTEADLPKESDWYLVTRVFNSRKYVATVFFNENTKSFYEDSCTPLNNITHWRLLPKAPESEAENETDN